MTELVRGYAYIRALCFDNTQYRHVGTRQNAQLSVEDWYAIMSFLNECLNEYD
jgi:hypothetical protein